MVPNFSPSQIRERRLTLFSPNSRSAEICCWIITKERGYVFKEKKWLMVFCIILTFFLALVYTEWLWTLSSIEIFFYSIHTFQGAALIWFYRGIPGGGHMLFKKYFPPLLRVPQPLAAKHHTAIDQNKAGRSHPPGPGYFLWVSPQHLNCQFNRPFPSCGHRSICPPALPCLKLPGAANRKNTKEITIKRAGEIGYFYFRKGDWTEKQLLTAYAVLSPEFFGGGWLYPGPPQNKRPQAGAPRP